MNIDERQLITQVFDHMRGLPAEDKDLDADRLIRDSVERQPDAPYRLVQSLLVQQQEMRRLEERVRDLEWAANLLNPPRAGASFLAPAPPPNIGAGAVPQVDGRSAQQPRDDRPRETATVPPAVPSFMTSALTTATGVAGGMLLTDGLHKLFGGSQSSVTPPSNGVSGWDRSQDELQDARGLAADAQRQLADDDAALDDAQDALEAQSDAAWDFGET